MLSSPLCKKCLRLGSTPVPRFKMVSCELGSPEYPPPRLAGAGVLENTARACPYLITSQAPIHHTGAPAPSFALTTSKKDSRAHQVPYLHLCSDTLSTLPLVLLRAPLRSPLFASTRNALRS